MANLREFSFFHEEIYELATTDPVLGGPGGITNIPPGQLANRTRWLYDELNKAKEALRTIHPIGEIQILAGPAYNPADYEGFVLFGNPLVGLGKAGTPAEGWALCNGLNGTADLRGRFAVGFDPIVSKFDTVGAQGGNNTITVDVANLPPHSHRLPLLTDNRGTTQNGGAIAKSDSGYGGADRSRSTELAGGSGGVATPIDITPPYYVLIYRQRIAN